eukprot:tig00000385_g24760.t1
MSLAVQRENGSSAGTCFNEADCTGDQGLFTSDVGADFYKACLLHGYKSVGVLEIWRSESVDTSCYNANANGEVRVDKIVKVDPRTLPWRVDEDVAEVDEDASLENPDFEFAIEIETEDIVFEEEALVADCEIAT